MAMENLVKDLVSDQDFYENWMESATDIQQNMFWKEIWDRAAKHHSDSKFVQGVYDYYQIGHQVSYKQFYYVAKTLYPHLFSSSSLKQRISS